MNYPKYGYRPAFGLQGVSKFLGHVDDVDIWKVGGVYRVVTSDGDNFATSLSNRKVSKYAAQIDKVVE